MSGDYDEAAQFWVTSRQSPDVHWLVVWREGDVKHELQTASAIRAEEQLQETGGRLFRWTDGVWESCGTTIRRGAK